VDDYYEITVYAQVANIGGADAGPYAVRAQTAYGVDDQAMGPIVGGATAGVVFNLEIPAGDLGPEACFDVTLIADIDNDVPNECDEGNNTAQQEICCTGGPGSGCPDPYFTRFSACYYVEQGPTGGASEWFVEVSVTVRNGGSVTATNVEVEVEADGESSSATIPTLNPGGTWAHIYTLSLGSDDPTFPIAVTGRIDPDNEIDESCYPPPEGEANNFAGTAVTRNHFCP
jgi:hypothetical protein